MPELKVAVVGGYGGMGRIFARLFKEEGFRVKISGPTERKGLKAAEELGAEYEKDNVKAVADADVVVVTVPMEATVQVIKEVAPHVRDGALLLDLTSVKEEPCRAMSEYAGKKVEVIGTHPIFGPRVSDIMGQVFVITPVRGVKWLPWLKSLLEKHKARFFESTPEEHDRVMAVVQGLTHYAYISLCKTLQELDFDIDRSRKFSSPVYELMLDMIGRIIGQDPNLYAEIQMENPKVAEIHKAYLDAAGKLSKIIQEKNHSKFVEYMADAAKHFGDVDRAMGRSDKAIASLVAELEQLKGSVGQEICLQHIYSGSKHFGIVKDVTSETVLLEDGGKTYELKLSNVRVLGDKERIKYKAERFGVAERDYSFIFNKEVDPKFISRLLEGSNENIISVEVRDVYSGAQVPADRKSVCFRAKLINAKVKETESVISEFFTRIGGRKR